MEFTRRFLGFATALKDTFAETLLIGNFDLMIKTGMICALIFAAHYHDRPPQKPPTYLTYLPDSTTQNQPLIRNPTQHT